MNTSRRKFIYSSALGLGASYLSSNFLFRLPLFGTGELKTIRKNVGYFKGSGGTIGWMINKDGALAIDAQFPDTAKVFLDDVRNKQVQQLDFLINTHHHGDHTAGNIAFQPVTKSIVAHENSKANQKRVAVERDRESSQVYPDHVFADSWSSEIGDEKVSCIYHGAAHTDGDIITHLENANVVHMGDLIFNRRFPYIDKSAGANIQNWIAVLDKTTSYFDDNTIFIFGHAGDGYDIVGSKEDIRAFRNYLEAMYEEVLSYVNTGMNEEEINTKMTSVKKAPEWKGKGIGRSISAAIAEIKEKK